MGRPAVFLDRDGTICREVDYLTRPEDLELVSGAPAARRDAVARVWRRMQVR